MSDLQYLLRDNPQDKQPSLLDFFQQPQQPTLVQPQQRTWQDRARKRKADQSKTAYQPLTGEIGQWEQEYLMNLTPEDKGNWQALPPEKRESTVRQIMARNTLSNQAQTKLYQTEDRYYKRGQAVYNIEKDKELDLAFSQVIGLLDGGTTTDVEAAMVRFRKLLGDSGNAGRAEVQSTINPTFVDGFISLVNKFSVEGNTQLPKDRIEFYKTRVKNAYKGAKSKNFQNIQQFVNRPSSTDELYLKKYGLNPRNQILEDYYIANPESRPGSEKQFQSVSQKIFKPHQIRQIKAKLDQATGPRFKTVNEAKEYARQLLQEGKTKEEVKRAMEGHVVQELLEGEIQ